MTDDYDEEFDILPPEIPESHNEDSNRCGGNVALASIPPLRSLEHSKYLMQKFEDEHPNDKAVKRALNPLHDGQNFREIYEAIIRRIGNGEVRVYPLELWKWDKKNPNR